MKDFFLHSIETPDDHELIRSLREQLDYMPSFCTGAAKLYLDSCGVVNTLPTVPSNIIQRANVVEALLGRFSNFLNDISGVFAC